MIGVTEEDLDGLPYGGTIGDLDAEEDENIYQFSQTVEGLDDMEEELLSGFGQTPATVSWVLGLTNRMLSGGVRRRDPQIRRLYQLVVRGRRLGRRSWTRRFLRTVYRRGIRARHRFTQRLIRQLRTWGYLPGVRQLPWSRRIFGRPAAWYLQPPWWYRRPPPWYSRRRFPVRGFPIVRRPLPRRGFVPTPGRLVQAAQAAALPVARTALGPGGLIPTAARLPLQAARTASRVATAPARFIRRLF